MPTIYLSPSTQEGNMYITGGSEEEWMNRLADAMVPYLVSSGIQYTRNTPQMTAASSIRQSNQGNYDLHLALHSNAAPEHLSGQLRGIIVFHYPGSVKGTRASEIIANNLKAIYPLPDLVRTEATTAIGEVRSVRAPAAFLELGYHDNPDDATWIINNLDPIARNIVRSLTEFFEIPFLLPRAPRRAVVDITSGHLNVRSKPSTSAPIIAQAYDGAQLTVLNEYYGWYLVRFGNTVGYVSGNYITFV